MAAALQCVMVRGVGSHLWSFPKGRAKFLASANSTDADNNSASSSLPMSKETPTQCAIREVSPLFYLRLVRFFHSLLATRLAMQITGLTFIVTEIGIRGARCRY